MINGVQRLLEAAYPCYGHAQHMNERVRYQRLAGLQPWRGNGKAVRFRTARLRKSVARFGRSVCHWRHSPKRKLTMTNAHTRALLFSLLTVASGVSFAQSASAPMGVGESASTAARAMNKAASSPDTGSVVRTGPSATKQAKHAANRSESSASSATHRHAHRARADQKAASAASE